MTVEVIKGGGSNEVDRFPIGMRVLAVDDNPVCLRVLETQLRSCQYHVTTTNQAITALKMLRENRDRFDLVISDVHMPDMDGFKLLELVGLEMDLPVIMLSANSDPKLVMKGVTHGACDYLVKPVRLMELKNIWQHVVRRKVESKSQSRSNNDNDKSDERKEGGDQNVKVNRKRKDEDEDEENGHDSDDQSTQKRPRVVWSIDLHRKFVAAVNQLGIEKAVPKRILDLMNEEGLTRENVASHLQKYRLYLKRISHQANMVVAFGGSKDASSYMRMNPLDGLIDFRTVSCSGRLPNTTYAPSGMLGRLNSANGVTIHGLNAPSFVQPNHIQNKLPPVVSSSPLNHQKMNLYQGIQPSLDMDHRQLNNKLNAQITDCSSAEGSRTFTGVTDPISVLGGQSALKLSSTGSETFNPLSNSPGFLNQSGNQPSNIFPNQLPIGDSFSYSATINGGFGSSITTSAVPLEPLNDGLVGNIFRNANQFISSQNHKSGPYSKQDYNQYSQNAFSTVASSALANGASLSGLVSQSRSNGGASTLVHTENTRQRYSEDYLPDQSNKLQGGLVASNGYGSLDDIMAGILKREQDPTCVMDGDLGYDPYGFGSCS